MVHTMLLASNYIPVRNNQEKQISSFLQQRLTCDVVFGSPSADCGGTGICKITGTNGLTINTHKKTCQRTQALLIKHPGQNGLTIFFFHSFLCSKLYRHHFWKGVLKMEEACRLPEDICNALDMPIQKIMPGHYRIVEEPGCFRVDVDCGV